MSASIADRLDQVRFKPHAAKLQDLEAGGQLQQVHLVGAQRHRQVGTETVRHFGHLRVGRRGEHEHRDVARDEETRLRRLVELNVIEQVHNLSKTSIIQNALLGDNPPRLYGLVYDIKEL